MKNNFYLLMLMFTVLFSCQKENDEIELVAKSDLIDNFIIPYPTIVENRLYFTDRDAFEEFMRSYSELEPETIDEFHEANGFKSLDFMEDNEEAENVPADANNLVATYLVDPWLTRVLNYNQEMQVGGVIYRVEDDYVYMYVDGYFDEIAAFENSGMEIPPLEGTIINDKLVAFKQTTKIEEEDIDNPKLWAFGYGVRNNSTHNYYSSTKRMQSTHWATNVFFYQSAGMKTKMQTYKGWWIFKSWRSENAKVIYVKGRYDFDVKQSGVPLAVTQSATFNVTKYNSSTAVKKMFEVYGIGVSLSGGSISGIVGPPESTFTVLKSSFSDHYTSYGSSSKTKGPIYWIW